jgi:hypothetical protein
MSVPGYDLVRRFLISLLVAFLLLVAINLLIPGLHCSDCFARRGWPFAYYNEGGFADGAGYIWSGVAGNSIVLLVLAALIAWGWISVPPRK